MSNADLLRAGYDAWNRGDLDGWLELLDPDIVIRTSGAFPDFAPEYRGLGGAKKFWAQMLEPWKEFRIEVEQMAEEGDLAAAGIRFVASGRDSGVDVELRFGSGIRIQNGLAVELVNRRTFEEVREALRESQRAAQPSHAAR
jgi:uncharacterized protein